MAQNKARPHGCSGIGPGNERIYAYLMAWAEEARVHICTETRLCYNEQKGTASPREWVPRTHFANTRVGMESNQGSCMVDTWMCRRGPRESRRERTRVRSSDAWSDRDFEWCSALRQVQHRRGNPE